MEDLRNGEAARSNDASTPDESSAGRALAREQWTFHRSLERFVNGGFSSRVRGLAAMSGATAVWKAEARPIATAFRRLAALPREESPIPQHFAVAPYSGTAPHVLALGNFLEERLSDALAFGMLHGSVATGEDIAYSDLDALVVLKDETVGSADRLAKAARELSRARAYMHAFDPIQHHGWFVLTEQDLSCHCDALFPGELFRYGALLFPRREQEIALASRPSCGEHLQSFESLSGAVLRQLESRRVPNNLYDLKTLLSQCMLLPSLYVQVRDGHGIWKGRSFDLARPDFPGELWDPIEAASEIRRRWPERRKPNAQPAWSPSLMIGGPVRQVLARRRAPAVPAEFRERLTPDFFQGMIALVAAMRGKIRDRATTTNMTGSG